MRKTLICCALAVTAAVGVAGCGGSSSGGAPANPQSDPKTTATAFIAALKSGDVNEVCKYVQVPPSQGTCADGLGPALQQDPFSGDATVVNDAVSGDKALVVTTGTFSVLGVSISNTDSNAGLPSGGSSFDDAYAAAQGNPKSPDLALVKVGDNWMIVLGS
mgnify:CR=1 FL=1